MTAAIVGAPTSTVGAVAGTTLAVNLPASPAIGNLLVMFIGRTNGVNLTATGWTDYSNVVVEDTVTSLGSVFVREVTGTEGSSITVTGFTGNRPKLAIVLEVTNHEGVDVSAGVRGWAPVGTPQAQQALPSVVTTANNALVLNSAYGFNWDNADSWGVYTGATQTALIATTDTNSGADWTIGHLTVGQTIQVVAGSTGLITVASPSDWEGSWTAITLAIKSAPAPQAPLPPSPPPAFFQFFDFITAGTPADTPPPAERPFFTQADWLWDPIPADPTLHANSAAWSALLAAGDHSANLYEFGVTLVPASAINESTPRYDIPFSMEPDWGSDPMAGYTMPIPLGTEVVYLDELSDGHLVVNDPITGRSFDLWQARWNGTAWTASWGGTLPLDGDGSAPASGTGAGIGRYAGVVTAAELTAAVAANTGVNHTLFFSTDIAAPTEFWYPASKTDGWNNAGVANPIPEGARVQLDPSIDIDAIPGITAGEKVIAKTLQTHGAILGDNGGARMAFLFEYQTDSDPDNPGLAYTSVGFGWDYFDMAHIPWGSLRVLNTWNGE